MMAGWYGVLFGIGTGWAFKPKVQKWALGGGCVFVILLVGAWMEDRRTVALSFLPGGPVTHDEPQGLLVDCGDARLTEFVLPRHLRARGVDRLEECVITHAVGHHAGGIGNLLEQQSSLRLSAGSARSTSKVQKELDQQLLHAEFGRVISSGARVGRWNVLHPRLGEDFPRSSDDAVVLRGELHHVRVLLLGDLGHDGRQALLRCEKELKADVLVLSKPARSLPVDLGFLRHVAPKVIVVQDCEFPVTQRASAEWMARLRASGAAVFSVRQCGGIRLSIRPIGWRLENAEGVLFSQ